jgi:subtilase family serine protease
MKKQTPSRIVGKLSLAALPLVVLIALRVGFIGPVFGEFQRDLITQPIDESKLVTVPRSTRPEARNPKNDRGPVPDSFPLPHMLLELKRSPALESELDHYINELTDKSSPNFRHWLTAQQIGENYGPSQQDLNTITSWLESHGFAVYGIHPNRMVIDFSGTAANLREAFHTQVDYLEVKGKTHFANMTNPKFPAALAPAVLGIVQIHDFAPQAYLVPKLPNYYISSTSMPLVPADFEIIYNVDPLFRQGFHGEGETVTIIEDGDIYPLTGTTDVAVYRSTFLSKYTSGSVTVTYPTGSNACTNPGANGATGEADLDGEMVSAMAPNATIVYAICADTTTFGGLLALENVVGSATPPSIVSISYGVCEALNYLPSNAAFSTAYQTAAAAGSSIFVSSGDESSAQCAPNFTDGTDYAYSGLGITGWGESVYNVSVGGTDFEDVYNAGKPANGGLPVTTYWATTNLPTDGSAKSYIPEIPWNNSCAGYLIYNYKGFTTPYGTGGTTTGFCNASGETTYVSDVGASGGPSACATGGTNTDQTSYLEVADSCVGYAKPSWQSGVVGNPADGVRDVPDVSMFASNGFWGHYAVVCFSDTAQGGTSCSGAPSTWSGFGGTSVAAPLMAGVQALVNQYRGLTKIGNPAPTYYAIAKAQFGSSGNPACYSVNQPSRRGLGTACAFNDITQGDNNVDCRANGSSHQVNCYTPSGTNGVISTQPLNAGNVILPGSGYTSAPSCSLGAPQNLNQYLSPPNPTVSTIWAGGTQASCTASIVASGTLTISGAVATNWAGITVTVGSTTYTFVTGTPTAVNQVELHTAGSAAVNQTDTAKNLEAVINATSSQCADTGCVHSGQTANTAASATESTNVVTLTAKTAGTGGDFTLSSSNTSDIAASGGSNAGTVTSITITAGGQGYQGGTSCTLTGGGGSGATCVAYATASTAAAAYQPAWGATPGWDFATGLGSVNAYNLAIAPQW